MTAQGKEVPELLLLQFFENGPRYIQVTFHNISKSFLIDELRFLTEGTYYINQEILQLTDSILKEHDNIPRQ
jgi:hypothetical protein